MLNAATTHQSTQDNRIKKLEANSCQKSMDYTQTRSRVGRNRNKQPPSHKEGINMKNAKVPNNPDMKRQGGWNPRSNPSHETVVGMAEVKSGEHAVPRPPKKLGGIQGTKVTALLLCTWTVYPLCNVIM